MPDDYDTQADIFRATAEWVSSLILTPRELLDRLKKPLHWAMATVQGVRPRPRKKLVRR